MKGYLQKLWPVLFILLLWLIFAYPYFLDNKIPYPATYQVNFFPPWNVEAKFWGPVKNGAMPDLVTQIIPWKKFTIETLKKGQIPLWNPYSFAGNPHLANFQSAVLSPFNILFFVLPFVDAWSLIVIAQPLLAAVFVYLLLRELGVSKIGSLIACISFMYSGFMVVWMAYGTLSMAFLFLPLMLLALEKFLKNQNRSWLIIFSLCLPLSFFSGHFQTSMYMVIYCLIYLLLKLNYIKNFKKLFPIGLALLFGLLLTLPQVLPSIELYQQSIRNELFVKSGGIPFFYLINIFAPDFFGNPVTRNDWFGYYAEWASFIGIIPLVLGFFAIVKRKNNTPMVFFISGIVALILAIDSPLQSFIGSLKIPVISTSDQNRIIVLFSFSFSVLAGFGLDRLVELISLKEIKKIFIRLGLVSIIFGIIWIILMFSQPVPNVNLQIARNNFILPTCLFIFMIILICLSLKNKSLLLLVCFCLLFATSFDSWRFAKKWMPFDSRDLFFPESPVVNFIKKNINGKRIYGNIEGQVGNYYNINLIEGYDPLYIKRYGEFIRSAVNGEFLESERSIVHLDRRGLYTKRVLDFLAVDLVFQPLADKGKNWAFPVWADKNHFTSIYNDGKFELYRNNLALPKVKLFYNYITISDDKKTLKSFYNEKFDFRNTLIFKQDINEKVTKGVGSATIVQELPNMTRIKVKSNTPGLLLFTDNNFPGWNAIVDSINTPIYPANFNFKAIKIAKGDHDVLFIYEPLSFRIGIILALFGSLGLALTVLLAKKTKN
ncbi:MAG: YfhO family protein [Candidatus Gottesmanbacteria bacterium]